MRLVLDDFGTGFSSLGYLKRFPLDGMKIDRSFVENVADGLTDARSSRAVIEMARALGLEVVAEGVETADQLDAVAQPRLPPGAGLLLHAPASRRRGARRARRRVPGRVWSRPRRATAPARRLNRSRRASRSSNQSAFEGGMVWKSHLVVGR